MPSEVTVEDGRLSVVGYVWEPTTELIGVDDSGAVWSYSPARGSRARGKIKPAAVPPDNRDARVKQLKKALKEIDRPAVKHEWWSVILEQVDDGIL
ncbi:hypothetical protein ACTMTJ_20210 [Phytohabitans sp. LJ34]|uniref:hypothetical protein n=1 Tax=Phytohabitans sp. LJ34 TaxID=3452217 RepID=UPI003F887D02